MDPNEQIRAVLGEEANVLARFLHDQEDELDKWPHRVRLSISNEIDRLHKLADGLKPKGAA